MIRHILALFLLVVVQSNAFAPANFRPASYIQAAEPPTTARSPAFVLAMSDEDKEVETAPQVSADGTFYDDELDSAPVKQGISDSMRERLIREASTGLDSEQKQTNVILYISIGVAILVILGGQGILY